MTGIRSAQLHAALILTREALALLEDALTATPKPARRSQPASERTPRTWRGRAVALTDDEHAVLQALDVDADPDGTYRLGRDALARACHMGAARLRTALDSLSAPEGGQALIRPASGPHGRTDYALVGTGEDDQPE